MVEILNFLKRIQLGIAGLQNTVLNHKTRHQKGGSDDLESLLRLANLLEKSHNSLTNVTASQHHTKTVASELNLADMAEKSHDSLADVSPNQHHPQSHSLASHSTKAHSELTGVTSSQHHTPGITFNLGLATVGTKQAQALIPGTFTISKVIAYADTAPVGADLKVNIKINGSSLWDDADRLIIANGLNSGSNSDLDHTALVEGNRITIDVDQVGSTTPGGNDLLVTIIC